MGAKQSLEHVAAYWYGADWIQMWGVNPEITVPDRLPDNALLRLGYLPRVRPVCNACVYQAVRRAAYALICLATSRPPCACL